MTDGVRARRQATGARRGSVMKLASTTYAATLLGLLTGPIVARVLGASGRGEYAAVMIYSSGATALLSLGMGLTINHAVLTLRMNPGVVLGIVLRFCAALVLPSLVLGVIAAVLLDDLGRSAQVGLLVFIGITPLAVLQLCLNSFLISEGALGTLALVRVVPLLINALGVVVLALVGALTVSSYLALTFAGVLATLLLGARGARIRPRRGGRLGPQMRFGLKAYPSSLSGLANAQLGPLLVAPVLGTADLGRYAVALTVAGLPLGVAGALSARATSQIAAEAGGLDVAVAAVTFRRAIALVLVLSIGLAIISPVLVPLLYGDEFAASAGLAVVLMAGTVATTISTLAGPALSIAGRPGVASIAEVTALAVTVLGLALLLPALGVVGAAVATVVAYWVRASIGLWSLRRNGVGRVFPLWRDFLEVARLIRSRLPRPVGSS